MPRSEAATASHCWQCGARVGAGQRYCTACGAVLARPASRGSVSASERLSTPSASTGEVGRERGAKRLFGGLFKRKDRTAGKTGSSADDGHVGGALQTPVDPRPTLCPQCKSPVAPGRKFCMECGYDLRGLAKGPALGSTGRMTGGYAGDGQDEGEGEDEDEATSILNVSPGMDEATTLLVEEPAVPAARLVRLNTGQSYDLELPAVVGKGTAADCVIEGNNAISRKHASFDLDPDDPSACIMTVLGATNPTRLEGAVIEAGESARVVDGQTLTFADEDFEFHLEPAQGAAR